LQDPLAGIPVRWGGGGPDGPAELLGAVLVTAGPRSARRVLETFRVVLEGLPADAGLREFLTQLDELAVRFGADGDGETCQLLLDYTADVASWGGRWQQ
jgi:hypothetical protein